jgi:predicted ATP-grasp superfamily ATP-dependent carboligase
MKITKNIIKFQGRLLDSNYWLRNRQPAIIPSWCKRILFSKRDSWEYSIRQDFDYFPKVELEFSDLSVDAVARADIVVPYEFSDLLWLAEHPELTQNKRIPIPSSQVVEICHNKLLFNSKLIELGFNNLLPKTHISLEPPFILKPNEGENSDGIFFVSSHEILERNAEEINKRQSVKQEFIRGKYEYATHMIMRKGELLAELTIQYRFNSEYPVKGKTPEMWRRAVKCPEIQKLAKILRAIGYEGICCFNYKILDGQLKLIELNPRFGGSLTPYFTHMLSMIATRESYKSSSLRKR